MSEQPLNGPDYANSALIITSQLPLFQARFGSAKESIFLFDDPVAALAYWEEHKCYLVFCDAIWEGKDMNGFDLARAIKKKGEQSRVLLMSSSPNEPNRRWAQRAGAHDLIAKNPELIAKLLEQEGIGRTDESEDVTDLIRSAFKEYVGPVGNVLIEEANQAVQNTDSAAGAQAYANLLASYITDKKTQEAFLEEIQGIIVVDPKKRSLGSGSGSYPQFALAENAFREQVGPIANMLIEEVRTSVKLAATSSVQLYVKELADRIPDATMRAKFLESLSHLT